MSLTTKVLIALALGMGVGIVISTSAHPALASVVPLVEPLGTLWINAIRMTVVPLVVGSIIVGVTSAPDARTIGRIGTRALAFFLVLLVAGGIFAAVVAPPLMARIPLDADAVSALRASGATATSAAAESVKKIPTFAQWLTDLVPINPVKAAADGAMLPLIVFSVCFGLALTRLTGETKTLMVRFFRGVADAALTLVRWVLAAAPIGVFALAVPLAAKLGLSAAGALLGYIVVTALVLVLFSLVVLYPLAALFGRGGIADFARGTFPAQAVAFSARSSLAALPAMMEASRTRLHLPEQITTFFLPLAATTFRIGGALGITTGVVFIAHLYGVTLGAAQMATIVLTVVMTTFSVPGIPAGSIIVMVPVLLAAGLPVEGMGILLGVDTIPDMFRTTANVTGDMVAASVLSRGERDEAPPGPAAA
ncbi:MAG: dicarboxylate/amino acid:cation symporter [Gemmatimonadetes bacterium]|nr:dicarboxylate/amino acid:cation symporter [Gemmatimonadota bacterium]MBK7834544.1 dicarboxylate/amino acid:cation symporter [Gemmatimonadota bacterium]MBK8056704.1 dicarboxylate/amino acid:cation symporter [Gemmatimonadota bacterium]MBK8646972.1 dicarboxylate/amino acid:cation symporter [Gemmatimonadota bacterium]MBK9979897.1 dicarboxylate/amino acid:cation symporter [Gemmatimonadota bacterium]